MLLLLVVLDLLFPELLVFLLNNLQLVFERHILFLQLLQLSAVLLNQLSLVPLAVVDLRQDFLIARESLVQPVHSKLLLLAHRFNGQQMPSQYLLADAEAQAAARLRDFHRGARLLNVGRNVLEHLLLLIWCLLLDPSADLLPPAPVQQLSEALQARPVSRAAQTVEEANAERACAKYTHLFVVTG